MMNIYLVRHAHAKWSADENRPLSQRGLHDAERLADLLARYPIGRLTSSPYRRAVQTIQPLAERLSLSIEMEDRFRERRLGDFGALSFQEAVERTWSELDFSFPDGESNANARARGVQALDDHTSRAGAYGIVISTHGNLLALILNHFEPSIGYPFWTSLTMPDVYRLAPDRGSELTFNRIWTPGATRDASHC
jgi:2,3-bisphosphoglycerate-dependent phosphoglycerate mutase